MCREAVSQVFMNFLNEQVMSCARDNQGEHADVQAGACHSNSDQSDSRSQGATSSHAVFFARVPPNVPYDELHEFFSKYGTVTNLNLYRRWATAKTSKGCGLVEYSTQAEAKAALDALNGNFRFDSYPGSEAPMVVEWMDASRLTPPADAAKPRKSNKAQSKANKLPSRTSSSSSSSSSTRRQVWPIPATQFALQNRAAAAAAAAAANYDAVLQASAFGYHSALEALAPYTQVLSPGACDAAAFGSSFASGGPSVEPMTRGSGVPVQLVPMLGNNGRQTHTAPQQQFSNSMANPQAAAFAMALSSMGGNLHTMSQPLATPFAGYRPSNADSCSVALAEPSIACSSAQLLPVPGSFMAEHRLQMAGGLGYPAAAGLRDELRPQDNSILAMAALCSNSNGLSRATTLTGAPSLSGACSSGSYTLFDSATLLGQMQESAAASPLNSYGCPGGQTHMMGPSVASGTALSAPALGVGAGESVDYLGSRQVASFSGALSGALPNLLAQLNAGLATSQPQVTPGGLPGHSLVMRAGSIEDCMVLPPPAMDREVVYADIANAQDQCLASPWGGSLGQGRGGSMGQEQQGLREFLVPLTGSNSSSLLVHAPSVATATGATFDVKGTPEGGLVLRIQGADSQVQAALQLMRALA